MSRTQRKLERDRWIVRGKGSASLEGKRQGLYKIREENNSRRTPTLRSYRIARTMPPLRQRREHKTPAHRYTRRYSPPRVLSSLYLALRLRVIKNDRPQASLKLSRLKARLLSLSLSLSLSFSLYFSFSLSLLTSNITLAREKFRVALPCSRAIFRLAVRKISIIKLLDFDVFVKNSEISKCIKLYFLQCLTDEIIFSVYAPLFFNYHINIKLHKRL